MRRAERDSLPAMENFRHARARANAGNTGSRGMLARAREADIAKTGYRCHERPNSGSFAARVTHEILQFNPLSTGDMKLRIIGTKIRLGGHVFGQRKV
jgi:hypothetical protein